MSATANYQGATRRWLELSQYSRWARPEFLPQLPDEAGHHITFLILTFMILALRGIIPASEV